MATTQSPDSVQSVLGAPRKKSGGLGKWLLILVLLGALAGAGYWYYQNYMQQTANVAPVYQTEPVKRGDISTTITATGNLQPMNQVDIGTELSGTVAEVYVDANDTVKKGQQLAKLNTDQLQDNITKMEAALASAQSKVAQAKAQIQQADAKIIQSKATVQQAIANALQSQAQVQQVGAQAQQNTAKLQQTMAQAQQANAQYQQANAQLGQVNAQYQQSQAQFKQANAQLQQAKATTLEARVALNRLQELNKASGGRLPARNDLDSATAAWQRAQAAELAAQSSVEAAKASMQGARSSIDSSKASMQSSRANIDSSKAVIDSAKAEISSGKASLASAQAGTGASSANVEGVKAAAEATKADKITAEAALDAANAGVMQAKADLRTAQNNLAKALIASPIDGVVLKRSVEKGQTVASSLSAPTLFTLAEDLKQMELQISVDEADVGQVKEGQKAEFTVDAWAGRKYNAVITRVSLGSTLSDNVVSYLTKLTVDNSDLTLRPGMTATATVSTQSREDVLLVPNSALRFNPNSTGGGRGTGGQGGSGAGGQGSAQQSGGLLSQLMPRMPAPQRTRPQGTGQGDPAGGGRRRDSQQVWILQDGQPVAVPVKIGLTDSKMTEIVSGDVKEGTEVITGTGSSAGSGSGVGSGAGTRAQGSRP